MPASLAVLAMCAATRWALAQNATSPAAIPAAIDDFRRDMSPAILAVRPCDAKHWRQIEPAVQHLALQHADRLADLDAAARAATLAKLAEDRKSTRLNSSHVSESRMPSSA